MSLRLHTPFPSSSSTNPNHRPKPSLSVPVLLTFVHSQPSPRRVEAEQVALSRRKGRGGCGAVVRCCSGSGEDGEVMVRERSVSVVLLAGGMGKRMGASMPKQYLPLLGQPIALYSFYTFSRLKEVKEIIVVCDPAYKNIFEDVMEEIDVNVKFALPGKERQDSVYNGFQEIEEDSHLVCVHDSARPLAFPEDIRKVFKDALLNGAAVLGVPAKATIKEVTTPDDLLLAERILNVGAAS